MSIGITQFILLVVVAVLLFGNIPKIFKDLTTGILTFKKALANTEPKSEKTKDLLSVNKSLDKSLLESKQNQEKKED